MNQLHETIQTADWKAEKHAPLIDAPEEVAPGQTFTVTAHLGAAIAHPNTPQHHIAWMDLFFLPDGATQAIQLAHADFTAHAASLSDAPGPALTQPRISVDIQLSRPGTLQALAYCNLHGLWQSARPIRLSPA